MAWAMLAACMQTGQVGVALSWLCGTDKYAKSMFELLMMDAAAEAPTACSIGEGGAPVLAHHLGVVLAHAATSFPEGGIAQVDICNLVSMHSSSQRQVNASGMYVQPLKMSEKADYCAPNSVGPMAVAHTALIALGGEQAGALRRLACRGALGGLLIGGLLIVGFCGARTLPAYLQWQR